jgi:penicillin-binding protein 2
MRMWEPTDFADNPEKNHTVFYVFIIVAFTALLAKAWYLQIIQGDELQQKSQRQQIREFRIPAARGVIMDRTGKVLAENRPSYNLFYHPDWVDSAERLPFLEKVCKEFDIDFETARRRLELSKGSQAIKIKSDIDRNEVAKIETTSMTYGDKYPLEVEIESLRVYQKGEYCAHVIGYCDEIDPKRLDQPKYADYRPGDLVGKVGIEESYEEFLAGAYGKRRVEVNARGNPIKEISVEKGSPGRNLVLNIDLDLTITAARLMGDRSGAVIVMDPRDGALLVALSLPSYDPEIFSRPLSKETWEKLANDKNHPLTNKYIRGLYPPGSTFKALTALAGLESGAITTSESVICTGAWKFGGREFRCHSKRGHGSVALYSGIVHSCDVYFYRMGFQMGIDVLAEFSRRMGLGSLTGIDITGEKEGTIPDKEWKLKALSQQWMPGDTLSAAIGQGFDLVTPLQMAVVYGVIANGGKVLKPRLVRQIQDQNGVVIRSIEPETARDINFDPKNLKAVRAGLLGVINDPGGTAYSSRLERIHMAGKTGTAQVKGMKKNQRISSAALPYEYRDHAWFVCYAPAEAPELVVSVLIEHGGHGGAVSAPIARGLIQEYYRRNKRYEPEPEDIAAPKETGGANEVD